MQTWQYVVGIVLVAIILHFDAGFQAQQVSDDLVASCNRVNEARQEINRRVPAYESIRISLQDFLTTASEQRLDKSSTSYAPEVGRRWKAMVDDEIVDPKTGKKLDPLDEIKFNKIKIPDCVELIQEQGY